MKHLISVFMLCGLLTLTACDQFRRQSGQERDSAVITDLRNYSDTLTMKVEKSVMEGQKYPAYSISVKVALTGNDSIDEAICKAVFGRAGDAQEVMKEFVDSLATEFTEELTEFYDHATEDDQMCYEYHVKCLPADFAKTSAAHPALSYTCIVETYQGGAHGSFDVQYLNFSAADGHRIRLNEVYDGDPCLAMMDRLLKDNGCKTKEELMEKTDILMTGDLYPTENFLLEGDSITFRFNAYEIAPYSSGAVEITVPCNQ